MDKIVFVACAYLLSILCLFGAALKIYEYAEFQWQGIPATMELAETGKKVVFTDGGPDFQFVNIKLVGAGGELRRTMTFDTAEAKRLAAGARIPVVYLKDNPAHIFRDDQHPDFPWGLLAAAVAAIPFARYAHKLLRRESGG